eukprot:4096891-Ditylum_brightwellii.AAC.1
MARCTGDVVISRAPKQFESDVDLAPGELCWAKRQTATEGSLGRDEWWPAMIMIVSDPKKKAKLC